jgi:hypothetical protein
MSLAISAQWANGEVWPSVKTGADLEPNPAIEIPKVRWRRRSLASFRTSQM